VTGEERLYVLQSTSKRAQVLDRLLAGVSYLLAGFRGQAPDLPQVVAQPPDRWWKKP
jgi:hypothetical protein